MSYDIGCLRQDGILLSFSRQVRILDSLPLVLLPRKLSIFPSSHPDQPAETLETSSGEAAFRHLIANFPLVPCFVWIAPKGVVLCVVSTDSVGWPDLRFQHVPPI